MGESEIIRPRVRYKDVVLETPAWYRCYTRLRNYSPLSESDSIALRTADLLARVAMSADKSRGARKIARYTINR